MPFTKPVVVIDNGSYNIKAGFACDNHPVSIFRTVVGRPKYLKGTYGRTPYEVYVGDDAVARSDELELNYPVVKGKITHWDNMERVWHHIFYRELKAAPEDRAVMLSCAPQTNMKDKIKCCEIFFEALNAPALCVKPQSVLALFGSGYRTGLSVDLGQSLSEVHPIYEGGSINYANMGTNLAGNEISGYIAECLNSRDLNLGNQISDVINGIIKECIYVTLNCAVTRTEYKKQYKLPSGELIDVSDEAFMAGEIYFQPDLVLGKETNYIPIQEALLTTVAKCDSELQPEMYDAIAVHGGMATMPGFNRRLARELEEVVLRPVNVIDSTEAYSVAWLGGAVFASMTDATRLWVLRKQFEEQGERIVYNRTRCCEIFFESLNAPALCIKPQSVLALFGSGKTTGLSVDLGQDITAVHSIYEGGSISYANMHTCLPGIEINRYLKDCFDKRGLQFGKKSEDIILAIRKQIYVTKNGAVPRNGYKRKFTLPSGQKIDVSDEVYMAGEMYFQPDLVLGRKTNYLALHDALVTGVLKIDVGLQSEMYDSIVIHGGMGDMAGFSKRLALEVEEIIHRRVNIIDSTEAHSVAWLGGSIFAGMTEAKKIWVTKHQFEDQGERIVRNRFY